MTAARSMYADLRNARARRARVLAEAYQRRRLRKPAVQFTAFAFGVVSVAINCNLLLQGTDYLIDARDLVGWFTLLTLQTAYRQRLFWGLLLPVTLGVGWLASLLVIGRAYAGYALHRRWWLSQTGSTPYSWLSPGSGYLVLLSRFLLVTALQGLAGLLIVLVRVLSVPAMLVAAEELWPAVLVYAGGGAAALLARIPVRRRLDAAVRRRGEIVAAQGGNR